MYGYIYKRVNRITNKIYVGLHKYESDIIKLDELYRGSGSYFRRALARYGEDNFTYELIDMAEDADELNKKEKFWISELNSLFPNGYNLTTGGDDFSIQPDLQRIYAKRGNKARGTGWKQSDKQRKIISDYMKNRIVTDETRKRVSKSLIGNNRGSGNKGKIWITDGISNLVVDSLDNVDFSKYHIGKTYSNETLLKFKDAYTESRLYVHKDGKDRYIFETELESFLKEGYVIGRCLDSYKERGKAISKWRTGSIKIVHSETGKVKFILPEKLPEFESLGYYYPKKLF